MIVFLDIGSTLVEGPSSGPAKRIAEALHLGPEALAQIEKLLFRTPASDATTIANHISLAFDVDLDSATRVASALWDAQLAEAFVLPGAREAVSGLKSAGIPRAYLSNIWAPFYACFEKEFADEAHCQPQFLSFRTGMMKPDPRCFQEALRAMRVTAQEAVMVGDTYENDIRPAIDAGMLTIWVLHRPEKERESLVRIMNGCTPPPDYTLASIADLSAELVRRLVHLKEDRDEDSKI